MVINSLEYAGRSYMSHKYLRGDYVDDFEQKTNKFRSNKFRF